MNPSLAGPVIDATHAGEALGRTAVYEAARQRIQQIHSREGVALPPGSTAPPPSVAARAAAGVPSGSAAPPKALIEAAEGNVGAFESLPGTKYSGVGNIPEEIASALIELVKPIGAKLTLYAVFIFGSVAMIFLGLSKLLEPLGGPDLKTVLTKAPVAAAAAA